MAGYSGTPLPRKLGIKEGAKVAVLGGPRNFPQILGELPAGAEIRIAIRGRATYDVIVFFTTRRADLTDRFGTLIDHLAQGGGLWVAWPKKSSGVVSDLTEDVLREVCLPTGLVDNKVCAIDETWSGLRFVRRRKK